MVTHSGFIIFITDISELNELKVVLRFEAEKLATGDYADDSTGRHIHTKLVIVPVRREDESLPLWTATKLWQLWGYRGPHTLFQWCDCKVFLMILCETLVTPHSTW